MLIEFGSPEAQAILEADRELRYEQRSEVFGTAECPKCHAEIELVAETEEWSKDEESGDWKHESFGPSMGYCEDCGLLIVDSWDGCYVYGLST